MHDNELLQGKITLEKNETRMAFSPDRPWLEGAYKVMVYSKLEDRSGNSVQKPFEVDVTADSSVYQHHWEEIDFEIK